MSVIATNEAGLGIIEGEPIEFYHGTNSVSHSRLEVFRDPDRGPARYRDTYLLKTIVREDKAHFRLGSGIDVLLLEGEQAYLQRTLIAPEDAPRRPTEAQLNAKEKSDKALVSIAYWSAFDANAEGKIVLTAAQDRHVRSMHAAVQRNADFVALLSVGKPQVTIRVAMVNFTIQIRSDWYNPEGIILPSTGEHTGPYLLDLKSAEDMHRLDSFLPSYYRQAATYREVIRMALAEVGKMAVEEVDPPAWFWGVVFKSPPIAAGVFQASESELGLSTDEITEDLRKISACYAKGEWPDVPQGINMLPKLKPWQRDEKELW